MSDLEKKFEGYTFEIEIPDKENFDPLNEAADVILTTRDKERYSANFVTLIYIPWVFEKNKKTGECDDGSWWGRKDNLLVVRRLDDENVRTAIDRVIKNLEIENYFKKID